MKPIRTGAGRGELVWREEWTPDAVSGVIA